MEFLRTFSQKNVNISVQGVRILDLKPVLETLINSTKNLRTRKWDFTARYLSKKSWSWQTLKKLKLLKILFREGADRIWLKLVWDTWDHPWTIPDLGFLWQFCSTHDGFKRTVMRDKKKSKIEYRKSKIEYSRERYHGKYRFFSLIFRRKLFDFSPMSILFWPEKCSFLWFSARKVAYTLRWHHPIVVYAQKFKKVRTFNGQICHQSCSIFIKNVIFDGKFDR